MTIDKKSGTKPINFSSVKDSERQRIVDFLQSAVYCWCKGQESTEFAARDLVGGENKDWNGTPLQPIYNYWLKEYKCRGYAKAKSKTTAHAQAGKDVGRLLKEVLLNDKRNFKRIFGRDVAYYGWKK